MGKKFIRVTIFISAISSLTYLVLIFIKFYNSPNRIEERCIIKFQKEAKKGFGKSDEEWGLNIDKASDNYFK